MATKNYVPGTTVSCLLETRRPNKEGKYPVTLRINYKRFRKYYGLGIVLTREEFAKTRGDKPREPFKTIGKKIMDFRERAEEVIDQLSVFSFEEFEKRYFTSQNEDNCIFSAIKNYENSLSEAGRASTAYLYTCTLNSLKNFTRKETLEFDAITVDFLNKYEHWMLDNEKSKTTIGMYVRNLRVILNQAIANGWFKQEKYPFGKGKYLIPKGQNVKKYLTLQEVALLYQYKAI